MDSQATLSLPNIGDKFQVAGAERWKDSKDINGEIVYSGKRNKVVGEETDIGFLVYDLSRRWFIIKASETQIYFCTDSIGGKWKSSRLTAGGRLTITFNEPNMQLKKIAHPLEAQLKDLKQSLTKQNHKFEDVTKENQRLEELLASSKTSVSFIHVKQASGPLTAEHQLE